MIRETMKMTSFSCSKDNVSIYVKNVNVIADNNYRILGFLRVYIIFPILSRRFPNRENELA